MKEKLYARIVDAFHSLPAERQAKLVAKTNKRIKATMHHKAGRDDLAVAALARRLFIQAISRGRASKGIGKGAEGPRQGGLATPDFSGITAELRSMRNDLKIAGLGDPVDKDVMYLCGLRHEKGTQSAGFYVLVALYILREETEDRFDPETHDALLAESEFQLAGLIQTFLARRLNDEAQEVDPDCDFPFTDVSRARAESDYKYVGIRFRQDEDFAERLAAFQERFRFGVKGNAHLVVYRGRRANPDQLIKTMLVLKWRRRNPNDVMDVRHHTLHLYRAPRDAGANAWATPGWAVPLEAGLFIVGGQRTDPMAKRRPQRGRAEASEPFRAIEVLYFPWRALEERSLFTGIALTVNDAGTPVVARICARATPLDESDIDPTSEPFLRLGSVPLADLAANLEKDRVAEESLLAPHEDRAGTVPGAGRVKGRSALTEDELSDLRDRFFAPFHEAGSDQGLAGQIAQMCNNDATAWTVPPGTTNRMGRATVAAVGVNLDKAFKQWTKSDGTDFNPLHDLRHPPLGSKT